MTTPFLRPIDRCWVATGPYGAPNYDEFASCDEVRAMVADRPDSITAVDNPQCFTGLETARDQLQQRQTDGRYARHDGAVLLYDLGGVRAVVGLVDSAEISSAPGEPGRLLRNEEVFGDKVTERRELVEGLRTLISPVLLVPDTPDLPVPPGFPTRAPLVEEVDEHGVRHRIWLLEDPGPTLAALAERTFFVADGNHRSLASQQAGVPCLAVVADPSALTIEPYHRLLGLDLTGAELLAQTRPWNPAPVTVLDPGSTHLYADGQLWRLDLPAAGDPVERLPHTVLERQLIEGRLGLDAAAVTYVGGVDPQRLMDRVDRGEATGALLMRAVTPAEFAAVNAARLPMPRKSTWFTPKARSGLVLASV
jgi:uncharacterized protein (DUF1015 family)